MALIFSLSIECGSRSNADALSSHFDRLHGDISKNPAYTCTTSSIGITESGWWCNVYPDTKRRSGICSKQDADEMTEFALHLYHHLTKAPPYRYAIAGVEVEGFRDYDELIEDLLTYPEDPLGGLVINREIWEETGSNPAFRDFSKGYYWIPYTGEIFDNGLKSYEALPENKKLQKLFGLFFTTSFFR
jgi:hypothetical protein